MSSLAEAPVFRPLRSRRSQKKLSPTTSATSYSSDADSAERDHSRHRTDRAYQSPNKDDPSSYHPHRSGINIDIVWDNATCRGKMIKHDPSATLFKHSKRFVILADRMLYTFKDDKRSGKYIECFELTKDTNAFVTDRFRGALYCIEIRRSDKLSWFLEAKTSEIMRVWLDRLKQTILWVRGGLPGVPTLENLNQINKQTDYDSHSFFSDSSYSYAKTQRTSASSMPYTSNTSMTTSLSSHGSFVPAVPRERGASEGDIKSFESLIRSGTPSSRSPLPSPRQVLPPPPEELPCRSPPPKSPPPPCPTTMPPLASPKKSPFAPPSTPPPPLPPSTPPPLVPSTSPIPMSLLQRM